MDDSIPNLSSVPSGDDSFISNTSDIALTEDDTATNKNETSLALIHQSQDEAISTYASLSDVFKIPLLPLDYFGNLLSPIPKLERYFNYDAEITDVSKRIHSLIRDELDRINTTMRHVMADTVSENLKQISLLWLEEGRIFEAAAKSIGIVTVQVKGNVIYPPEVNIYEETGTLASSLHLAGSDELFDLDAAILTKSARVEAVPAQAYAQAYPPTITGSGNITLEHATLSSTGSFMRPRRSVDANYAKLATPLQAPIKLIRKLLVSYNRLLFLTEKQSRAYTLSRASAECVLIKIDDFHIGSVTYTNGEIVVFFPPTILMYRPELWTRDYQALRFDIEQHLSQIYGARIEGALIVESGAFALAATVQPILQTTTTSLSTAPKDSGINADEKLSLTNLTPEEQAISKRIIELKQKAKMSDERLAAKLSDEGLALDGKTITSRQVKHIREKAGISARPAKRV